MRAAISEVPSAGSSLARRLTEEVEGALEGKPEVVRLVVVALLARGHVLLEDVPGVGKTTLAKALAKASGLSLRRLQFTSDLLPADVVGSNVFDPKTTRFELRPGPVFTEVLLADEINRTTPKTQSALLEAMDEHAVTIDGTTRRLPEPFFVLATQNPEDFHGTFPLPESQLDRFLLRLRLGHPPEEIERRLLRERRAIDPIERVRVVTTRDEVLEAQRAVDQVHVDDDVLDYLHAIVLATRRSSSIRLGASTRAALALERSARAHALADGRSYVLPDDVRLLAVPTLAHRIQLADAPSDPRRRSVESAIESIVAFLPIPT